jgi:hypothetical protein
MATPKPDQKAFTKDIQSRASDQPGWDNDDVRASLDRLYADVLEASQATERWYWRNKSRKAFWSQLIKWLALTLTGLGAIVPVALMVWPSGSTLQVGDFDSGLLTSLLMGLAAGLVGFDRAWGFSSGWTRYVLTATAIRNACEEFRMDWILLRSQLTSLADPARASAMIERAKTFHLSVEALVLKETQDWAAEFQNSLAQLEKDVKAKASQVKAEREKAEQERATTAAQAAAASVAGSVEVIVVNAQKTDGKRWSVRLVSKDRTITEDIEGSKNWTQIGVPPGEYNLNASALINKVPARANALLNIKPGETTKVELTLLEPEKPPAGKEAAKDADP